MPNELITIGPFRIWYDHDANTEIYSKIATSGPAECNCDGCAAFIAMRETLYPPEFKKLLESLGVEYTKEAEVVSYSIPGHAPLEGWYNFVGRVELGEETLYNLTDNFQVHVSNGGLLAPPEFNGYPLVKLEWRWPPYNVK
jgi:hypothetical protein